jgi:hypothetical protein
VSVSSAKVKFEPQARNISTQLNILNSKGFGYL